VGRHPFERGTMMMRARMLELQMRDRAECDYSTTHWQRMMPSDP
jgi:hypothetical protein